MNVPIFTICSCNFLPQARTLFNSIRTANAASTFIIFLVDAKRDYIDSDTMGCTVIYADDISVPNFNYMKFIYTITELNTAVKPYCFRFLFSAMGQESAIYLDPDVLVLRPLEHVERALAEGANLILTPHITTPIDDDLRPSEMDLIRAGIYNLGFVAMRNTGETRKFLAWWGERLQQDCVFDLSGGYHVDQKFFDMAPGFVEKSVILRHPGYNLAYWNIAQRKVRNIDNQLFADGEPVHFIHFSSVDFAKPRKISRHQNRLTWADFRPLRHAYGKYLESVAEHTFLHGRQLGQEAYAYERFLDGRPIALILRRAYRDFVKPHDARFERMFAVDTEFFNARAQDWPEFSGLKITKLYDYLWRSHSDLRSTYNLHTFGGQCRFLAWAKVFLSREIPQELIVDVPREAIDSCDMAQHFPFPVTSEAVVDVFSPAVFIGHILHKALHGKERALTRLQRRLDRMIAAPDYSLAGSEQLKEGAALFGFFKAETAIGELARRCAGVLSRTQVPFSTHLMRAGWPYREDVEFGAAGAPWNSFKTAVVCANADTIADLDRFLPETVLAGRRRIGYWNWELPVFPAAWAPAFWRIDEIWTPSTYSRAAIAAATGKPVHVVPIAVPDEFIEQTAARKRLGFDPSDFIVLTVFDLNSYLARKNPMAAVRAYADAFAARKETRPRMVVKLHGAAERGAQYRALLDLAARHDVTIIDELFDQSELRLLQAAADAFVSLHRAEGFGLNIAECMSLAKPVIVTAFSGNMDFTTAENSYLVPWKMRQVMPGEYPHGAGQWWADPDHDAAVAAFRSVFESPSLAAERGARARKDILAYCSEAAVRAGIVQLVGQGTPDVS